MTPPTLPLKRPNLLPPIPLPFQHPLNHKMIQPRILPRRMLTNPLRLRPLPHSPRPIRDPKLPDRHIHQPRILHVPRDIPPALDIPASARRHLPHSAQPRPVSGTYLPVSIPLVRRVLHFRPRAGTQQRSYIADVSRPIRNATHEQSAKDEVDGGRGKAGIPGGKAAEVGGDEVDVWRSGDGGDGGDIDAGDVRGGEEGAEVAGDGAGAAAEVEDTGRLGEGGMDNGVVHELGEAGGLVFETGVFGGAGGVGRGVSGFVAAVREGVDGGKGGGGLE